MRGRHTATVDEKGRLKIPVEFKEYLDKEYGPDYYVTSIEGDQASVYPLREWEHIEEKLKAMPSMSKARAKFIGRTSFWGQLASSDAQGRILIPQHLREKAQLQGAVAVMGFPDHFEVWNLASITQKFEGEQFTDEDRQELSNAGI